MTFIYIGRAKIKEVFDGLLRRSKTRKFRVHHKTVLNVI